MMFSLSHSSRIACFVVAVFLGQQSIACELPFEHDKPFVARDTLDTTKAETDDVRDCLSSLGWEASEFEVTCVASADTRFDALVQFSSPISTGNETNDRVAMEWSFARNEAEEIIKAPAVIVVHESGSGMFVGRLIARSLAEKQIHTFMIQLPGYGERVDLDRILDPAHILNLTRQAVADVRRAHDAVSALPFVDTSHIGVQGTSLGGFVSATAAGLDGVFDSVHLLLAGGDLYDVVQNGKRDAAQFRRRFEEAGYTGEDLKRLLHPVEPNRLAHRLDPESTWLYSALHDTVVAPRNSILLAEKANLPDDHHVQLNCDHYSGIGYLPLVLSSMEKRVHQNLQPNSDD